MDPIEFLASHPPFERLPAAALATIGGGLEIAYRAAGDRVLTRGGEPSRYLFVIRKGTVRLERDGQLLQVLEEGECFGFPSLIGQTNPLADAVVADDALLYLLPGPLFTRLMEHRSFAEYFLADLAARLRHSASAQTLPLGAELGASLRTLPL